MNSLSGMWDQSLKNCCKQYAARFVVLVTALACASCGASYHGTFEPMPPGRMGGLRPETDGKGGREAVTGAGVEVQFLHGGYGGKFAQVSFGILVKQNNIVFEYTPEVVAIRGLARARDNATRGQTYQGKVKQAEPRDIFALRLDTASSSYVRGFDSISRLTLDEQQSDAIASFFMPLEHRVKMGEVERQLFFGPPVRVNSDERTALSVGEVYVVSVFFDRDNMNQFELHLKIGEEISTWHFIVGKQLYF